MKFPNLPIVDVLPDLIDAIRQRDEAVLQAPPGAGKTTIVPLALLDQPWLVGQKILMLEPRRLAARAAAERMAELLGETVGQTVGYRMRLETRVSAATRIEVITEGILTRLLQSDPSLAGIGLIIFDEFHERSLDADLGLALALQGRRMFRNPDDGESPLKILLMSATLDEIRMTLLLSRDGVAAPLVRSEGRQFPVVVRYVDTYKPQEPVILKVIATVLDALRAETGSVLVFLPGQAEIRAVNSGLAEALGYAGAVADKSPESRRQPVPGGSVAASLLQTDSEDLSATAPAGNRRDTVILAPLFGDLSLAEQRRAIAPVGPGQRKVVLATNIAESSLTIEGISVVVDSGLARAPVFDPGTGMTRLQTRRLSKASSIQRMGRAGRLQAGVCYRLWSESQQEQLQPFTPPEILQADLAPLALQLVCWGIDDPAELDWLDPPPQAAYQQALDLLLGLNAIRQRDDGHWAITEHGQAMANFPAHPRLAHMLLLGVWSGLTDVACDLAALLSDRDPLYRPDGSAGADIADRVEWLQRQGSSASGKRLRQQSQQFRKLCEGVAVKAELPQLSEADAFGFLIASAWPDRIAKSRERNAPANVMQQRDYALSNGRAATLRMPDHLEKSDWLAVATLGGRDGDSRDQIHLATRLNPALFEHALASMLEVVEQVDWDSARERFRAERQRRIGRLVLDSRVLDDISPQAKRRVLLDLVRRRGLSFLPWTDDLRQWQARVALLRQTEGSDSTWPDISDANLLATLDHWLGPYVDTINHINGFARLDLTAILHALLPWPLPRQLDEDAPVSLRVPSGSSLRIDYSVTPPVFAVRIQEMFGCAQTPVIARGKIELLLHLLSPAKRPLAVTQDLASFWQNTYPEVKKEGKGRYPKHYWPDNPLEAEATARAKPRK